ncbi:MAG: hypothetical protein RSC66_04860 [Comamonas sp.]
MKETGLMFKAPLVRSILDGTKTQTRRVVPFRTLQLIEYGSIAGECHELPSAGTLHPNSVDYYNSFCPMGQPGDRIYVRETWQGPLLEEFESDADSDWMSASRIHQYQNPAHCQYAADGGPAPEFMTADDDLVRRWRPAIHMPKWAARIWLDITGVRVERLQDISAADAKAEGIEGQFANGPWRNYQRDGYWFPEGKDIAPILSFSSLWESTGGDWYANPWVWVIDFKRDLAQKGQP